MKIGILRTSSVGQAIAAPLDESGHAVMVGTRNMADTLARTAPDAMGNQPFSTCRSKTPRSSWVRLLRQRPMARWSSTAQQVGFHWRCSDRPEDPTSAAKCS